MGAVNAEAVLHCLSGPQAQAHLPGSWEAGETPAPLLPRQLPQDHPALPKALGASTPHHMSMLVVCVVVPSSSSGARYLRTGAPTLGLAVPLLWPGLHEAPWLCTSLPTGHHRP